MSYSKVEMQVIQWAEARKIIQNQKPATALLKLVSEVGELCDAEAKGNVIEQIDAIGDTMVCLINYCAIKEFDLTSCLESAYTQIKDRKGEMLPNGIFVKETS